MTKKSCLALVACSAAMALAACGSDGESATSAETSGSDATTTAAASGDRKIAYLSPIQGNSFIQAIGEGVREAADAGGAELEVFDANGNPATQINQIQSATASGEFDGFVIVSFDGSVVPAINRAVRDDVKVVCVFTVCGPDQTATSNQMPGVLTSQIGVDARSEGEQFAAATIAACEGVDPCQVAYIPGLPTAAIARVRGNAFLAGIEGEPNIDLVASEQSGEDNVSVSLGVARDLITAHPDLDVITAAGGQSAEGVQKALRGAGKLGRVKIISGAGSAAGIARVADGTWFAEAAPEFPATYGRIGVETLLEALDGRTVPEYIDGNAEVDAPGVVLQRDARAFRAEWSGN